jgi:hypothetical protein
MLNCEHVLKEHAILWLSYLVMTQLLKGSIAHSLVACKLWKIPHLWKSVHFFVIEKETILSACGIETNFFLA